MSVHTKCIAICATLMLLLSGCLFTYSSAETMPPELTLPNGSPVAKPELVFPDIRYNYKYINKQYAPNSYVNVSYPFFYGDDETTQYINGFIENKITEQVSKFTDGLEDYSLTIDYGLMQNSDVLSLLFTGVLTVKHAAHPREVFFTVNLSRPEKIQLYLEDIVDVNNTLVKLLLDKEIVRDAGPFGNVTDELSYLQHTYSEEEILNNLIAADKTSFWCIYIREDSIGIVVPLPHAMCGYCLLEVDKSHFTLSR